MEDRIVRIETGLAFQEQSLEELTRTLLQLQRKVNQLETTCRELSDKLRGQGKEGDIGPQLDKPPHY